MSLHNSRSLLKSISYPPPPKKPFYSPPHTSQKSRELLETYKKTVHSKRNDLRKFILTSGGERTAGPTAEQLASEGKTFMEKNDVDGALSNLLEAIRMGLDTPEVYTLAGDAYRDKGMATEAIEMYTKSLERDPMNKDLYQDRGNCYLLLDDFSSAVDEFEKYIKLDKPVYDLLVKTGKACLDAERFDRALELLTMAQEMDPDDAYVLYNLGELHERTGEAVKASRYYGQVSKADSTFAEPYLKQAALEEQDGNLPLALHLYECILKMRPQDPHMHLHCADIYLKLGDEFSSNSLTCLTRAIELSTGDDTDDDVLSTQIYVKRGVLLFDQFSDLDAAICDFTVALSTGSRSTMDTALEYRAACFRQRNQIGDLQAAKDDYEKFVTLPNVSDERKGAPCIFLAEYYFSIRKFSIAAGFYQQGWSCNVEYKFEVEKVALSLLHAYMDKLSAAQREQGSEPTIQISKSGSNATMSKAVADANNKSASDSSRPFSAETHKSEKPPMLDDDNGNKCLSLQQIAFEAFYRPHRELEPTAHTELFYSFHDIWASYSEEIAKKLSPEQQPKGGKKLGKKK